MTTVTLADDLWLVDTPEGPVLSLPHVRFWSSLDGCWKDAVGICPYPVTVLKAGTQVNLG